MKIQESPLLLYLLVHGRMQNPRKRGWGIALDDVKQHYPDFVHYDGHDVWFTRAGSAAVTTYIVSVTEDGPTYTLADVADAVESWWLENPPTKEELECLPSEVALLYVLCDILPAGDLSPGAMIEWMYTSDMPKDYEAAHQLYGLPRLLEKPL